MQTFPPGGASRRPPSDPLRARKADRWDALVQSGMSPDRATAAVEQEFSTNAPKPAASLSPTELQSLWQEYQSTKAGHTAPAASGSRTAGTVPGERARLRAAGFTDAEINAELGPSGAEPMTPPVRRRSLSEIADESFGGGDPGGRARARAAGFTDAEIDAELGPADPYRPPVGRAFASESTAMRGPGRAPARAGADAAYAVGLAREVGQGASFGFGDEIEARVRAAFGARPYQEVRDAVRGQIQQFRSDNPLSAVGAQVVGGLVTGGATMSAAKGAGTLARVAKASQLAPQVGATASTAARIGAATRAGAAGGALYGAGNAEGMDDLAESTGVGLLTGGLAGGLFGGVAEGVRGARNLVARVGQGEKPAGAIRQAIRADAPDEAAARRVLRRVGAQGMTLDDVAARSGAADGPDVLAEVLGAKGVRDLRTARALGHTAPDAIEETLTARARNDVGGLRQTVRQELGDQVDDVALRAAKRTEAQQAAGPLYDQALDGVTISDPRMVKMLRRPVIRQAYATASKMAENDGAALPPVEAILRRAGGAVDDADDAVMGAVTRRAGRADAAGDDALNMTQEQLRTVRRGGPLETMTTADLDAERLYLQQQQGDDLMRAAIRETPDYQEYLALREIGAHEDARGVMERMGYFDPVEFNQAIARDAGAAAKRAAARQARIDAVEAEFSRREQVGPARAVPGRGAVALPEAGAAPELPTMTGTQWQYVKHAIDDQLTALEGKTGGTTTKQYAQLMQARNDVDALLYEFANPADDGASLWGAANRAYAKPLTEADAFAEGVRGGRGIQAPDVPRLLDGPAPEWRARGVANTIQDDLGRLAQDEAAGMIRNPAPVLMGSDAAEARLLVAARGDAAKAGRVTDAARNVSRRLKTRGTVLGGSQTGEKLADMQESGLDASALLQAARSPTGAAMQWLGQQGNSLRRNVVGQDMDALSRLLLAGGPKQMTRDQALQRLRDMEPAIVKLMTRQAMLRGAAGTRAADGATR